MCVCGEDLGRFRMTVGICGVGVLSAFGDGMLEVGDACAGQNGGCTLLCTYVVNVKRYIGEANHENTYWAFPFPVLEPQQCCGTGRLEPAKSGEARRMPRDAKLSEMSNAGCFPSRQSR